MAILGLVVGHPRDVRCPSMEVDTLLSFCELVPNSMSELHFLLVGDHPWVGGDHLWQLSSGFSFVR